MKKLALMLAAVAAAAPALAESGGWVAKVDARPVLYAGPDGYGLVPRQFSRDDAYFSYRGGSVSHREGKAYFDYDRSYPYDFAPLPPQPEFDREPGWDDARESSCELAPVRNGRGGGATVRICRN